MAHDRVNGKCYFGSTFQTLEKRKKQHIYYAKKNKNKGHFYASLAKRPNSFFWIALKEIYTKDRKLEQEYLDKYFGLDWCYNIKNKANGAGTGSINCGNNQSTIEKRKKKYKEALERGDHLFQKESFRVANSEFQKELIDKGKHNFTKSQGKGANNAYSNSALWKRYDKLFKIWEYYGRPKEGRFATLVGFKRTSFKRMIDSFLKDIV